MLEMWERQRQLDEERRREDRERDERRRSDEREREERMAARERERLDHSAQREREFMAAQQAMGKEQTQMLMTVMTAAMGQNKGGSLPELITAVGTMMEMAQGGSGDTTTELIKAAPTLLGSLKEFGQMKMMGAAGQQAQQQLQAPAAEQTDEQLGQQAAANMLTILMRKGYTQAEAEAEVMKVYGYLDSQARKRVQGKAPAPRRAPAPPASPSNGSGSTSPAGSAGPATPTTTVQQ
jgi:hypothetical protein